MKKILLIFASLLITGGGFLWAQSVQVSGVVTENGQPIPATVVEKGTTNGVNTDDNGRYTITVSTNATLIFTSVGYKAQEIAVGGRTTINVSMESDIATLEGAVVTAYGVINKKTFTGAASSVSAEKLENKPVATLDQALQGNVAGMLSSTSSGQPGADSKVLIRGIGSINAGTDPLYVIDGVPITIGDWATAGGGGGYSSVNSAMSSINPNDIESVTVLKDAAATSIYGSRASNGVILITTKKGKEGKPQFSINLQGGMSGRGSKLKMLNASQYIELNREAMLNSGYNTAQVAATFNAFPRTIEGKFYDTDWQEDFTYRDDAMTYSIDFSVSGGDAKTKYYASLSNYHQDAIMLWGDLDRKSARVNITHQGADWINFGFNLSYANTVQNTPTTTSAFYTNPAAASLNFSPLEYPYNLDGTYNTNMVGNNSVNYVLNNNINDDKTTSDRILGNAFAEIKFLKDFRFRSSYGVDMYFVQDDSYTDARGQGNIYAGVGYAERTHQSMRRWTNTNTISYMKTFNEKHNVNVLVGQEAENFDYDYVLAGASGFASYKLRQVSSGAEPVRTLGSKSSYRLVSFLGNASYDYDGKYFATASFRRDGSSKFSVNNRWASFWSIGGAWDIAKESFLSENAPIFNSLKLRASYGTSGNSDIGYYNSYGLYGFSAYNGLPTSYPAQAENPDLTWESQALFNVGIDFEILERRLGGTIEYYNRTTDDLLLSVPLSYITGFGSQLRNVGSVRNQGIEITINATPIQTETFTWKVDANWSMNKNKVLNLSGNEEYIDNGDVRARIRPGYDMSEYWLVNFAGVDPATGRETWFDRDGNITFQRDYASMATNNAGTSTPKWQGGLTNTLSAYGFDLSCFFFFNYGNMIFDNVAYQYMHDGHNANQNEIVSVMDRWQKPGDISPNPRRLTTTTTQVSTRFLYDGSYIRLRNLNLGYTFPKKISDALNLSSLRVFVQGQNLFTITNYPGQDPEVDFTMNNFYQYPVARTFMAGIDVKF